jgi:FkbM family methyltransferase
MSFDYPVGGLERIAGEAGPRSASGAVFDRAWGAGESRQALLTGLHGAFSGQTCFIIGNGPSLRHTDLQALSQEFTFGLNRIYLNYSQMGFQPTFFCCANPHVLKQFAADIDAVRSLKFLSIAGRKWIRDTNGVFFLRSVQTADGFEFVKDLSLGEWSEGWTVTYCAMQVAYYLGFSRVVLIGVDHNYPVSGDPNTLARATGPDTNHFHEEYFSDGVVWEYPDLVRSERAYRLAKEVYEESGREIVDATIGGKLRVFRKVDFEAELVQLRRQGANRGGATKSVNAESGKLAESGRTMSIAGIENIPKSRSPIVGPYTREQHAHLDESQVMARLILGRQNQGTMIDVGAHHGSALAPVARTDGWRVFAFEPDPENRRRLEQRYKDDPAVTIDSRAVSDCASDNAPFYSSDESTGISTLSPFRKSHEECAKVSVTTVADVCREYGLDRVDYLKIDTEGFDLMVLKGVPWERLKPAAIECEFEDNKTLKLGYTFHDIAGFLLDKGYTVYVSEWFPVRRYGVQHDWHRLTIYPTELTENSAWGNLMAFQSPPEEGELNRLVAKLVKCRANEVHGGMPIAAAEESTASQSQARQSATSLKRRLVNSFPFLAGSVVKARRMLSLMRGFYRGGPGMLALGAIVLVLLGRLDGVAGVALTIAAWLALLTLVGVKVGSTRSRLDAIDLQRIKTENAGLAQRDKLRQVQEKVKEFASLYDDQQREIRQEQQERQAEAQESTSRLEELRELLSAEQLELEKSLTALRTLESAVAIEKENLAMVGGKTEALESVATEHGVALSQLDKVLKLSGVGNKRLFQKFTRELSEPSLDRLEQVWLPALGLERALDRRAIGYFANKVCFVEDRCTGRLATNIEDALLRLLVARAANGQELSVMEIGTLFGIGLASVHEAVRGCFARIHLSAVDPLDGYYDKGRADLLTKMPVTEDVFWNNLRQVDVPDDSVTLIKHLSTDEQAVGLAAQRAYDVLIVDGDHSYEGVANDFVKYSDLIRADGYLVFDDYDSREWPAVKQYVDDYVRKDPRFRFVGADWRTAIFQRVGE